MPRTMRSRTPSRGSRTPSRGSSRRIAKKPSSSPSFTVGMFLCLYVATTTAVSIYLHYLTHTAFNFMQMALSFFLCLNFLIALWEIALGTHPSLYMWIDFSFFFHIVVRHSVSFIDDLSFSKCMAFAWYTNRIAYTQDRERERRVEKDI